MKRKRKKAEPRFFKKGHLRATKYNAGLKTKKYGKNLCFVCNKPIKNTINVIEYEHTFLEELPICYRCCDNINQLLDPHVFYTESKLLEIDPSDPFGTNESMIKKLFLFLVFLLDSVYKIFDQTLYNVFYKLILHKPDIKKLAPKKKNLKVLLRGLDYKYNWQIRVIASHGLYCLEYNIKEKLIDKIETDNDWKARKYFCELLVELGWEPESLKHQKLFSIGRRNWIKAKELQAVGTVCIILNNDNLNINRMYEKPPDISKFRQMFPEELQESENQADFLVQITWRTHITGLYHFEGKIDKVCDAGYIKCLLEIKNRNTNERIMSKQIIGGMPVPQTYHWSFDLLIVGEFPLDLIESTLKSWMNSLKSPLYYLS